MNRGVSEILSTVQRNYRNPLWWRNSVLIPHLVRPVHSWNPTAPPGQNIVKIDWDSLLILDACRVDLFEEVANLNAFDSYATVNSLGSATPEWLVRNFSSEDHGDTVYVSGNPWVSKIVPDSFHQMIEVWRDSFDQETGTVHPEPLIESAKSAVKEYPNKRLIVHFVQPHHPFVEQDSEDLSYDWINGVWNDTEYPDGPSDPWEALEESRISREEVWEKYANNLQYVLEPALRFARELDGKTVITSDHGNMLGERAWPVPLKIFGHPEGVRSPELIEVPWAVIEDETRRHIEEGAVNSAETSNSEIVNDRLRHLGYKE